MLYAWTSAVFFDSLCSKTLKQNWCEVLGMERLPPDHFNIYKSLVNFTYINERDCIKQFGQHPRRHKKGKSYNLNHRLCSYEQLRKANQEIGIIHKKTELNVEGIPQGSPISGLIANIFMIHFDMKMRDYAALMGGFYRRYSDDIFFAFPKENESSEVVDNIQSMLRNTTGNSLKIGAVPDN